MKINRRKFCIGLLSTSLFPFNIFSSLKTKNQIKGIYIPGWKAISRKSIDNFIELLDKTEINTLMIDVKNARGEIFYEPRNELALEIDAQAQTSEGHTRKLNLNYLFKKIKNKNVRLIARHVMFRDHHLYKKIPKFRLFGKHNERWVNLMKKEVVDYNLDLLKQESLLGFDEIVLDYIRFPATNNFGTLKEKCGVIDNIVKKIKKNLPTNIDLGVQIFGYSAWDHWRAGVGQRISTLAPNVNSIYPMIYPSHFWPGSFGFANPNNYPYEFIVMGYTEAMKKIRDDTKIIPMIQAWGYSPEKISDQISATKDYRMPGYICWNSRGKYQKLEKII